MIWRLPLLVMLLISVLSLQVQAREQSPLIFAAASTRELVEDVLTLYQQQTGERFTSSFAGSGTLARQIEDGAPADIFLSAHSDWTEHLAASGSLADGKIDSLVSNRLVWISTSASSLSLQDQLQQEVSVAIGDPRSVPAGRYAKQALMTLGLWESLAKRIVPTRNVRAALALVERQELPLAIVYRTDALSSDAVRILEELPASSHDPIHYSLALTKRGASDEKSRLLFEIFLSREAASLYEARGFGTIDRTQ